MDTVTNMTHVASKALFGESGHDKETRDNETQGREPVSGQLGNVAAGEPYDGGNLDTPKAESPTIGGAENAPATTTATNGKSTLFNPILSAAPGESSTSDYTSSARRASAISADSRTSEMRNPSSPTLGHVVEKPAVVEAVPGASQQRNGVAFDGKDEEPRKTSDPSVTYDTRAGGRRKSRQGSGSRPVTDRGELAFRSVSREHERRQSQRNALAPLNQTESTRRRAASGVADDGLDERVGGPIETDSTTPVARERKLSLKDKIKARFAKV